MTGKLIPVLVLLCLAFVPVSSRAERIGNMDVEITPRVSQSYDDNITYASENERDDFITDLTLGLSGKYEGKLDMLRLGASISHHIYNKYSSMDNTDQTFDAMYFRELDKYQRIRISDSFTHAEDPASFEDAFGRSSGRYAYYTNDLNARYYRDITSQLSGTLRYGNSFTEYSTSTHVDSFANSIGGGLEYAVSSADLFLIDYGFNRRDYDQSDNYITANTITGGMRHFFTKQLYIEPVAGFTYIESSDGYNETNPSVSVSLVEELNETTTNTLVYSRESTSSDDSQYIFDSWRFSANVSKQLYERLKGTVSAFYGEGEYKRLGITDELQGLSLSAGYDLTEDMQLTARYSYSQTESNVRSREYERNYVSLGLSMTF